MSQPLLRCFNIGQALNEGYLQCWLCGTLRNRSEAQCPRCGEADAREVEGVFNEPSTRYSKRSSSGLQKEKNYDSDEN